MKSNQKNDAYIKCIIAATGSGKGVYLKNIELKKRIKRLFIWDFMHEYENFTTVDSFSDAIVNMRKKTFKVVYRVNHNESIQEQFKTFCDIAFAVSNVHVVIEELSQITKANYCPPSWKKILVIGRHKGLKITATTQRPALIDKTILGQATDLVIGRLRYTQDAKVVNDLLKVDTKEILTLPKLKLFEKNMDSEKIKLLDLHKYLR